MADHAHSSAATEVPAELVDRSQKGWKAFTHVIVLNCLGVAALLVFLLVVFKVIPSASH